MEASDGRKIKLMHGYGLLRISERRVGLVHMPSIENIKGMSKADAQRAMAERMRAEVVDPGPGWWNEYTQQLEPSPFVEGDTVKLGPGKGLAGFTNDPDWPRDLHVFAYADVVAIIRDPSKEQ